MLPVTFFIKFIQNCPSNLLKVSSVAVTTVLSVATRPYAWQNQQKASMQVDATFSF
jgi:hypothetical protein